MGVLWPRMVALEPVAVQAVSALPVPLGADLVELGSYNKTDHASAYRRYTTSLSPDFILAFYDVALAPAGWQRLRAETITTAAVAHIYCLGGQTLKVSYYGVGYEWRYETWLELGPGGSECALRKGGGLVYLSFTDLWFLFGGSVSWLAYSAFFAGLVWTTDEESFSKQAHPLLAYPVGFWRMRLRSALGILTGLAGTLLSVYKLSMYLLNS